MHRGSSDMTQEIFDGTRPIVNLTWEHIHQRALKLAVSIEELRLSDRRLARSANAIRLFPIPRGGIFAAQALQAALASRRLPCEIVEAPVEADYYIDDIIDSGNTRLATIRQFGDKPFYALVNKKAEEEHQEVKDKWYYFPWERMTGEDGLQANIIRTLEFIGEDPTRPGLLETPKRVQKAYEEMFAGYRVNKDQIRDMLKIFNEEADEMILCKGIEFYSTCEHHMLPFIGEAHVAYIPNANRVVGLSKLPRLVDVYARRLQIQERIARQVTAALDMYVLPKGSACIIEARHLCVQCRGVSKQHSSMVTSSLTGVFREKPEARAELFSLIKG
jgi:GTP cyclohydrolase I